MRDIWCDEPWFTHIRLGRKAVEGRKASPTWSSVAAGDVLRFRDPATPEQSFVADVVAVRRYAPPGALRRYLEGESLERALPGVSSLEDGEAVYLQWSSADEIESLGMLGIEVRVRGADDPRTA